ncbi:peroxisomal sarcosine oxidase-like isoform X2 [Apostichopus japonicus]|uniref:peroxisomal sarcosine oxidase-like isoform X2 n=1 Tax=Stichopus japonicus TaxID=307972 RepID=UPI003AB216DC
MKPLGLNLPIRVVKITLCYWTEKIPGQSKKYPTFCDFGIDKPDGFTEPVYVFGFPSIEYNGLRKISVHHGTGVDPDQRDSFIADETKDAQFLLNYMKRRFPEYIIQTLLSLRSVCILSRIQNGSSYWESPRRDGSRREGLV